MKELMQQCLKLMKNTTIIFSVLYFVTSILIFTIKIFYDIPIEFLKEHLVLVLAFYIFIMFILLASHLIVLTIYSIATFVENDIKGIKTKNKNIELKKENAISKETIIKNERMIKSLKNQLGTLEYEHKVFENTIIANNEYIADLFKSNFTAMLVKKDFERERLELQTNYKQVIRENKRLNKTLAQYKHRLKNNKEVQQLKEKNKALKMRCTSLAKQNHTTRKRAEKRCFSS